MRRPALFVTSLLVAVLAASGCSGSSDALVLYNAQNRGLMTTLTEAFTEKTGIEVEMRNGGDSELSNQLIAEGERSPADLFTTENATAMAQVSRAGLFSSLPESALAGVPEQYVAADRAWVGVAARSTVLVYNTDLLDEADLPASMLDLAEAEWDGRFGYAPTGADFQAIAAGVYAVSGDEAGDGFVQALADQGRVYANNIAILKAVNSGEVPAGIIYHYYWYQDRADTGENSADTALHFFGNGDPGAFLSVGGAGVLGSSEKQAQAQQFVAFLASAEGQRILSDSGDFQYAITNDVPSNPDLEPLDELDPPVVPIDALDGEKVLSAFRAAGIL